MKRRVEDQELIFAPQQQQSRRPPVQGIADSFQQRALAPAPNVIEAAADNMQPSTGIQYSLPQSYQVWMKSMICSWTTASRAGVGVMFWSILDWLLLSTKFQNMHYMDTHQKSHRPKPLEGDTQDISLLLLLLLFLF